MPKLASYCVTYQGGEVMEAHGASGRLAATGYLNKGRNWFVCQAESTIPNPRVGEHTNNYWLRTLADKSYANGGWGWFPATFVTAGVSGKPVPGVPICPEHIGRLGGPRTVQPPRHAQTQPAKKKQAQTQPAKKKQAQTQPAKKKVVPKPAQAPPSSAPAPAVMAIPAPARPPRMPPPPPPPPPSRVPFWVPTAK
ncbi:hypothetical protein [Embleya sp. NPDC001921]